MTYYLDFDRTMFDTEAFKEWLWKREGTEDLSPEERVLDAYRKADDGTLSFAPGELSRFLYQDAAAFLREKENSVTVITYGNKALQEAKTKSAFHGIPRVSVMLTGDVRKGVFLAPHAHLHAGAVLADDTPLELEIISRECPGLALYEVRRDGKEEDGRWPVVRSLSELP
ncbi:MAG: hypothetical protein AB199_04115 [Parcubacteria bacterium C7867-004]|nr:MAG: hypothetical protein AB199_04115 [Parcubacteria bacterium C7867-004]